MTDGPHKSLPLKRPWRVASERTANPSFSLVQTSEAIEAAVRAELASIPFDTINKMIRGDGLPVLFTSDVTHQIERLESARLLLPGSAAGSNYIDSLMVGLLSNSSVEDAINGAALDCVRSTLHSSKLSVVEHYKRKGASTQILSTRWDEASGRCEFQGLAREVMQIGKVSKLKLTLKSGLDDGPG